MTDLAYAYAKLRCNFGRQPMFCEHGPEMCDTITDNAAESKLYILRNPVNQTVQNVPVQSCHEINTIRPEYTSTGVNHAEGGWPKDVNCLDIEATQRYRRKVEKDDPYIHCVFTATPGLEHYLYQNNAIDIYRTYYAEINPMPGVERHGVRTVNVYKDPEHGRPVSSICWEPEGGQRFAVTYADVDYFRTPRGSVDAYLWNVENANVPETTLVPPCTMLDLQFNPHDHTTLIGGLVSGQVAAWDQRNGSQPVNMCPPHVAHRDLVRGVLFINSKSGMECFSGGPDGACKWWDLRNMSEPTDVAIIDVVKYSFDVQSMANSYGISVIEYESTLPTRFMVGSENGHVVAGNRKGKSALEKLPAIYDTAHVGPVLSLERNPFSLKNFLTVGDWRVKVWTDECRDSALLWSPPHDHKITCATWSPTRCSVMLSTAFDGRVSVWDLLRRQHVPVLTLHLCDAPLTKVKMQDQIFERESKRERILEARLREIRLKQRQAEEGSPRHSTVDDPSVGGRDLAEVTQEYMAAVRKEIAAV